MDWLEREFTVRAGFDLDPACEWPFKRNVKADFFCDDVAGLSGESAQEILSPISVTLLAVCAPCQRFSNYTQKKSRSNRQRWRLLDSLPALPWN